MKNLDRKSLFILSFCIAAAFFVISKNDRALRFSDNEPKNLAHKNSYSSETVSAPTRSIASLPDNKLLLYSSQLNDQNQESIVVKNSKDSNWVTKLRSDLLRFTPANAELKILPLLSTVKMIDGEALLVEKVLIQVHSKKFTNSYNAYVDSETGRIIETWNQTIHEKIPRAELKFKAYPLETSRKIEHK